MSDETSLAYQQAKAAYIASRGEAALSGQDPGQVDSSALTAAAQAHVTASEAEDRPLDVVMLEYDQQLTALHAGTDVNREEFTVLGQALSVLRSAIANTEGNLPSGGHSVGVGVGT